MGLRKGKVGELDWDLGRLLRVLGSKGLLNILGVSWIAF